jgi:hypothetical protein
VLLARDTGHVWNYRSKTDLFYRNRKGRADLGTTENADHTIL